MIFNVAGLLQEGIGATREYDLDGAIQGEDGVSEAVSGDVELLCTQAGVLVRAHLRLVEPETCSRCAAPLTETVKIEFEEEFIATFDAAGHPISGPRDDDAFLIDSRHTLDLTEAVRQYREASREMAPLCRPDCKGLCANCGADLNVGDHACDAETVDNRWAALAALKGNN
ncbi:MAG TPA: DUF177 domain-containing protein [Dehalococcoidia bacterium]|nr:DUF177 domain-containing protein [Dehalococcoidia bacterium]